MNELTGSPNWLRAHHYLYDDNGMQVADPVPANLYTDGGRNLTADVRFVMKRAARIGDLTMVTEVSMSSIGWRGPVVNTGLDRNPDEVIKPGYSLQVLMSYALTNIIPD